MDKINVKILNPDAAVEAENMMVAMARMTQKGHAISTIEDFEELYNRPHTDRFVDTLADLPHPTLQKFGVINVVIVGASRRFLAQITRHQNEVKFMSGSLQYSDYSDRAQFVVPYEVLEADNNARTDAACYSPNSIGEGELLSSQYLSACEDSMSTYKYLVELVGRDAAGYAAPQGLRNVLVISATPYQWKHMICQRTCNRNTLETQYIMLSIWDQLYGLSEMFKESGPFCTKMICPEGNMSCCKPYRMSATPSQILDTRFKLLRRRTDGDK